MWRDKRDVETLLGNTWSVFNDVNRIEKTLYNIYLCMYYALMNKN